MDRNEFLETLIDLLVRIEGGMGEFEEPLPQGVGEGIVAAVVSFGTETLPIIHKRLIELQHSNMVYGYLIDILGEVGDPGSIPHLIECHKRGFNLTSTAGLQALRKLGMEAVYEYMGQMLIEWCNGNKRTFNSGAEIVTSCLALGDWNDVRAIEPLKRATSIYHADGMPRTAIEQLAKYPQAHEFLKELAFLNPSLAEIIQNAIYQT